MMSWRLVRCVTPHSWETLQLTPRDTELFADTLPVVRTWPAHLQSRVRFSAVIHPEVIYFLKRGSNFSTKESAMCLIDSNSDQLAFCSVESNWSFARALIARHELNLSQNGCIGRDYATGDDLPVGNLIKKNNAIKGMTSQKSINLTTIDGNHQTVRQTWWRVDKGTWRWYCDHIIQLLPRM